MTYEKKNWLVVSRDNMFDLYLPVPDGLLPDGLRYSNVIRVVKFPNVVDGGEVLKPAQKEDLVPCHHRSGKAWKIFITKFACPDTFSSAMHLIFFIVIFAFVVIIIVTIVIIFNLFTVTA